MPNYTWRDKETDEYVELKGVAISDRDIPPSVPGDWERVLEMPAIKRRTYLDGQRRKTDKAYADYAKAAELRVTQADMVNPADKARVQSDINKLEKLK